MSLSKYRRKGCRVIIRDGKVQKCPLLTDDVGNELLRLPCGRLEVYKAAPVPLSGLASGFGNLVVVVLLFVFLLGMLIGLH